MSASPTPRLLIGDPDTGFLNALRLDARAQAAPPLGAANRADLEKVLTDPAQPLSGVFLNPKLVNPFGVPLVRIARQHRPTTPIFLLLDDPRKPLTDPELKDLTIVRSVPKPITYFEIMKHLASVELNFDSAAAIRQAQGHADLLEVETVHDDAEFVPIIARNFVAAQTSYFDVYVQVRPKRYVKVLQAGDGFSPARLQSYLDKQVLHFYLRKDAQETYLRYCDQVTAALIKNPNVPASIKIEQTLNHGQETSSFLRGSGVDEKAVRYCEKFTENVQLLVKSIDLQRSDVVRGYLGNLEHYEHGVATVMVASLIAIPLKFEMGKSLNIIGLAAMLHDIGLQGLSGNFCHEDETKMDERERRIFQGHPIQGANMLRQIRGIEPVVIQAVEQHHERRSRKGFPYRLGSGNINRVSEIIGISEEFVHLIARSKLDGTDPFKLMEHTVFHGFSSPVITAFQMIFMNRHQA